MIGQIKRSKRKVLALSGVLASRLFHSGRQNSLIAFIARIASVGMTLAVAILVLVLSVMNGFEQEFRDKILGLVPHATLEFLEPEADWKKMAERVVKHPNINRVIPYVEFKALLINGVDAKPILVQGVEFDRFEELGGEYLSTDFTADQQSIVLGAELAKQLNIEVGQKVRLLLVESKSSTHGDTNARRNSMRRALQKPVVHTFTVASILLTGTEIDNSVGLIDILRASNIKGLTGSVEGLQLQVDNVFNARDIARAFFVTNGQVSRIFDWTQSYGNLYVAIQLSRQMVVMLLTIIIAVAVFNVFVTLGMVVRYKRPEIAILRTMGMPRAQILMTFIYQGLLIATPGCFLGLIVGCIMAWLAPNAVEFVQLLLGIEFLSTEVYPINYLPSKIRLSDLVMIAAAAISMSFIATLYPAWKASNLQPAKVLNEHSS